MIRPSAVGALVGTVLGLCASSSWAQENRPGSAPGRAVPEEPPKARPELPKALADQEPEPPEDEGFTEDLRIGKWVRWNFDATTSVGRLRISNLELNDGGVDLGYHVDSWTVTVSFDYAADRGVQVALGGLSVGRSIAILTEEESLIPVDLKVAVGVVGGHMNVAATGFGNFENAVGFQARLLLDFRITEPVGIAFWADYRHLEFRYSGQVLSGDRATPGSSVALGV
ncbi:MAG TPA: hypothetical protein VEN81_07705, partial [Planctomycetota bacterium]|nr:hypothetical protein [Planctomycetota bacterium]